MCVPDYFFISLTCKTLNVWGRIRFLVKVFLCFPLTLSYLGATAVLKDYPKVSVPRGAAGLQLGGTWGKK